MTKWLIRSRTSFDGHVRLCATHWSFEYSTVLSAGNDTSSKTLMWYFYAIAKHLEAQARIREEIALVRARTTGEEFNIADLNSMAYTLATTKVKVDLHFFGVPDSHYGQESMRLDPIGWIICRIATRDDIIPLTFPVTTKSGEQITSIPIKKGTPVDISSAGYNR